MSSSNNNFLEKISPHVKAFAILVGTQIKTTSQIIATKTKDTCTRIYQREKLIRTNRSRFQQNIISESLSEFREYKEAVFKQRLVGLNFSLLMKLYTRYLYPKENNQEYLVPGEMKLLLTRPYEYVVMTKLDYQKEVARQVSQQLAEKVQAVRQEFIDKLLPFTSSEQKNDLDQDYFAQKDSSRVNYYSQQKRLEKIEERERKTELKEEKLDLTEHKLDAQREQMEVKNERLGLQSDKLDLEKEHLNIDKKHLDVQKEKLGVAQDRLELEKVQIANERKLFELQMTRQDIEHRTKMLELTNLSLDIQKKSNDTEQMKKEMEITQALHDLETQKREQTLEYGQQMLQLKEQGLGNEMLKKEAEFLSLQMDNKRTRIDIENKIMDLREGEFKQEAKEHLMDIKEKKIAIDLDRLKIHRKEDRLEQKNNELKLQLKQEQVYIETKAQKMHDEQQNLIWKLQDQKSRLYDSETENGRLIQELRHKPSYISWQDV